MAPAKEISISGAGLKEEVVKKNNWSAWIWETERLSNYLLGFISPSQMFSVSVHQMDI